VDSTPRRPARSSRWPVAITASAVLHVLLGGALWLGRVPPAVRRPAPIEFTLVQLPPLPRPGTTDGSAPASEPRSARPVAAAPAGRGRSAQGVAAPAPPALPASPDRDVDRGAEPVDLAWADAAATPVGQRPDLSARPPPEAISLFAPSDPSPEARLQRLLREDVGRAKVASGLANPFFLDFGRAILKVWEPETVITDRGISGYVSQLGKALVEFAEVYADQAARYGRTGSPFAPGTVTGGIASLAAVPEGITTQISDQLAVARAMADQSRVRHAALVRVVQRADGRLVSVELVRPSDDSSVDAQALRDLREAAAALPAPTPGALGGRPTVASIWEFSLVVSITPPLPVIAVQFDEVLGLFDARVPLDRRLFKRVRLVSVE